jgi:hypothetical protein
MCCLHMGACRNVGPWSLPPSVRGSLPCFGSEASEWCRDIRGITGIRLVSCMPGDSEFIPLPEMIVASRIVPHRGRRKVRNTYFRFNFQ